MALKSYVQLLSLLALLAGCDAASVVKEDTQRAVIISILSDYSAQLSDPTAPIPRVTCVVNFVGHVNSDAEVSIAAHISSDMLAPSQRLVEPRPSNWILPYNPKGCDSTLTLSDLQISDDKAYINTDWVCGDMCGVGAGIDLERGPNGWKVVNRSSKWVS